MSSFSNAITSALAAIDAAAGISITYDRRGSTVSLTAVPGKSVHVSRDRRDMQIRTATRDYLFNAANLIINSEVVTPKPGDEIKEVVGGKTFVYRVSQPDGNDDCYRYSDHNRSRIRVHTVHIDTE